MSKPGYPNFWAACDTGKSALSSRGGASPLLRLSVWMICAGWRISSGKIDSQAQAGRIARKYLSVDSKKATADNHPLLPVIPLKPSGTGIYPESSSRFQTFLHQRHLINEGLIQWMKEEESPVTRSGAEDAEHSSLQASCLLHVDANQPRWIGQDRTYPLTPMFFSCTLAHKHILILSFIFVTP